MGSRGGHYIPMGAFAVQVSINVGNMGSSEKEAEAWLREVEHWKRSLAPAKPALTALADVYLRGDHPYRFLRDRLDPVFPELPNDSDKIVGIPLDAYHLGQLPRYDHPIGLGVAARERLMRWEKNKIAANFHLSQRGPNGYLQDRKRGPLPMDLFDRILSHKFLGLVEVKELLPWILEGGRLPELVGKAFEQWTREEDAWEVATSVLMLARDEDLEPWKAFCVEKARLKFPDGNAYFPEWVTERR